MEEKKVTKEPYVAPSVRVRPLHIEERLMVCTKCKGNPNNNKKDIGCDSGLYAS